MKRIEELRELIKSFKVDKANRKLFLKISLKVLHLAIENMFCLRVLSCWMKFWVPG